MNPKPKPTARYDVRVKQSSAGLGLFAAEAIPRGKTVIEYVGRRVPARDDLDNRYIFSVNARWDIDGSPRWNTARYINHSCRPNCEAVERRGRIFIVSRRAIGPGEELTYHYGRNYFDNYIGHGRCRCKRCIW